MQKTLVLVLLGLLSAVNGTLRVGVISSGENLDVVNKYFPRLQLSSIEPQKEFTLPECNQTLGSDILIGPSEQRHCSYVQHLSMLTATPVLYTSSCPAIITSLQLTADDTLVERVVSHVLQLLRWAKVGILTDNVENPVVTTLIQSLVSHDYLLRVWNGDDFGSGLKSFRKISPLYLIVSAPEEKIGQFLKAERDMNLEGRVSYLFTTILPEQTWLSFDWTGAKNPEREFYILVDDAKPKATSVLMDALLLANQTSGTDREWQVNPCNPDWHKAKEFILNYKNINVEDGRVILKNGKRIYKSLKLKKISYFNDELSLSDEGDWTTGGFKSRRKRGVSTNLVVTSVSHPPFMMKVANEEMVQGNDKYEGFLKDLLDMIADKLGYSYTLKFTSDGKWGSLNPETGRWNGMIGELINNGADIAAASLTQTSKRNEVVDISKPFLVSGLSVVYKRQGNDFKGSWSMLSPFSWDLWICLIGAWLFASLALYVINRINPPEEGETLAAHEIFWYLLSFIFFRQERTAKSASIRGLSLLWCWFSVLILVLYSSLAAYIYTSSLSKNTLITVQDFLDSGMDYGCLQGGATAGFFQNSEKRLYKKMGEELKSNPSRNAATIQEGIGRVVNSSGDYAFIVETPDADFAISQYCSLAKLPTQIHTRSYGIALQKGSVYTQRVSHAILQLEETGAISDLYDKWWKQDAQCSQGVLIGPKSQHRTSLTVYSVGGVLVTFALGVVLCVGIGFGEMFYYKRFGKVASTEIPKEKKVKKSKESKEETTSGLGNEFRKLKEREAGSRESLEEVETA